jgi:YD repeat-containing protein
VWSSPSLDLSALGGQAVQLAFHLSGTASQDWGWYVDEIALRIGPEVFRNPESFELGWGDWFTDSYLWQVRKPGNGPVNAHTGTNAACGNLGDNYPDGVNSRLVSSILNVPQGTPGSFVILNSWQWYQYGTGDAGLVQVSRWNGLGWDGWVTMQTNAPSGSSGGWRQAPPIDLTAYQGQQVRVAFYHTANSDGSVGAGWFIDDLSLTSFVPTPLTLGQAYTNRFTTSFEHQYFVIDVPAGGHLRLRLNDLDNLGANEIYLRRGALPSAGVYDARFSTNGAASQSVLAADAGAGKWYVEVYGASGPLPGYFTLQADFFVGVALESVSPSVLGNSVPGTLDLRGAGFTPSAIVSLANGGTAYLPTETSVVSGSQMLADFNFNAIPAGAYSLRVTSGTNSSELPFTVTSGGQPGLTTKIILPRQVGYHMPATIYVEYSNTGQVATLAPILEVSAQQNGRRAAILTLDESRLVDGFWTAAMPEGFANSVQFLASGKTPGILQPGESGRVPIYYAGWQQPWDFSYSMIYWNLSVLASDGTNQIDWMALKDSIRPSALATNQWEPVFFNLIAQVGLTWGDYVRALDNNARYLAKLGVNVTDIRDLLSFEVMQASGLGVTRTLASALDAQVQSPGLPITFTRSFIMDIPSHFRLSRFGRGWSDNWDYSLTNAPDGTVTILGPSGSRRVFQPDSRDASHYFAQPGDTATLTSQGGGAFALQEASGTRYAYSAGKLQSIQDTHTNRITCTYTGDQLTRLTHSAGPWLQIAYTGARVAAMEDSVGRQTTFAYDGAAEHLASVTDYRGLATSYQYQSLLTSAATHALTDIGKPDGTHQFYAYDAQGRLASKSGCCGTGGTTTYTYDSAGKVTATDCLTNVT